MQESRTICPEIVFFPAIYIMPVKNKDYISKLDHNEQQDHIRSNYFLVNINESMLKIVIIMLF